MIEPRIHHSRSTRDGLGYHPDGTHPCTPEGEPDFEKFDRLEHVLDFILNTKDPHYNELVAAMVIIKLKDVVWALRSILAMAKERQDTNAALPYWTALYIVTIRCQDEATRRDPFLAMYVKEFRKALETKGIREMISSGWLPSGTTLPPLRTAEPGLAPHEERIKEAVTQATTDEIFDQIINHYQQESN